PAEMTESFTTLKYELKRPWENGDEADTLFSRTTRAYLIAGAILYQTALPAEKREMYVNFSDERWRKGIKEMVNSAYRVFASDAGSLEARKTLTEEMDSYVRFVEAQSKRDAATPEQTMNQAIHANTLFQREETDRTLYYFIDP